MSAKKTKKEQPFDAKLKRLAAIVEQLEEGDLPLEDGVALFKEGQALSKACSLMLENARNEVKLADGSDFVVLEEHAEEDDLCE